MMSGEEMIFRYNELYHKMVASKDPAKMKIFGEAEKWIFEETVNAHPDLADSWLSCLEAICWDNFLSHNEAENIGKHLISQNGTRGFHWLYDEFINTVKKLGGETEENPFYNTYALYVTANMIYSDHAESIAQDMGYNSVQEVPPEKMALSCYKKAVEKLKDKDRPRFVRDYFKCWL